MPQSDKCINNGNVCMAKPAPAIGEGSGAGAAAVARRGPG